MSKPSHGPVADLLYGVKAIAEHLSMTEKQVYHMHDRGTLPTFALGRRVCARRSGLDAHFAQAAAGQETKKDAGAPVPAGTVLYGHRAIADHLGRPVADVARLDMERRLPTYQDDGCTVASVVALDHWKELKGGGHAGAR